MAEEIFNILKNNNIPAFLSVEATNIQRTDKDSSDSLNQLAANLTAGNFDVDFITEIGDYQTQLIILGVLDRA